MRRRYNANDFDPRATLGPDEVRDMIPHVQAPNAGTPIFNQHQMTVQEILCLTQILNSLPGRTRHPVTMADLHSMLNYTFNGWDTSQDAGHPPALVELSFYESRVQTGALSQDHPLSAGRTRPG
ncbi:hypothetical protein NW768_008429 [Fusarium equiseti]|uniref:Uncharacterized protein n=1 Tax=Fusarium equiseti TaxID=61235 RepID=A0ABQ8R6Z7_FUSEQ|nr:hypothetical protein NW768_008429 [Fusarium equiseti]